MRTTTLATALVAAAALAACSASTTGASSGATTPGPATSTAPSASATTYGCADLPAVAATLTRTVHYVALDVGTTNDPSQYFGEVDEAAAALGDLATRCAPAAAAGVAALASSLDALETGMVGGTDAAAVSTDVALLKVVRADGVTAYRALKLPTAGWENAPENRVAG